MRRTTRVEYVNHDTSENEKTGNLQMQLELLTTAAGEGEEPREAGERAFKFLTLTPNTIPWVAKELRLLGMTNNDVFAPEGLGGTEAILVEQKEEWNGEWRWRSKYINDPNYKAKEKSTVDFDAHDDIRARMMEELENIPVASSSDW